MDDEKGRPRSPYPAKYHACPSGISVQVPQPPGEAPTDFRLTDTSVARRQKGREVFAGVLEKVNSWVFALFIQIMLSERSEFMI